MGISAAVAAPIAGAVVGSLISGGGASSAGQTAAQGAQQGSQTLQTNLQNLTPNYQPYQNLGQQGVSNISTMLPYFTNQFNNADLNANLAPNYAFQLGQGQQANAMATNAAGGAVGGNALTALQNYTQGTAGNAYQQAFNNYQAQRGNIYNSLASIANIGQNAVAGLGNLATGTAQGVASLQTGAANAQAAGQVGAANAYSGGIQNAGNMAYLGSLLGQSKNGSTSNAYANMGLVGNDVTGYTYSPAAQVGPFNAQLNYGES
jgi:hypothetical protein